MSEHQSVDCCEAWPKLQYHFAWMCYADDKTKWAMPHFQQRDGTKLRVNHCPSCGAEVRNITIEAWL